MISLPTPPLGWVLDLLNEAHKRAKSSGCFGEVDYVYMVNKSAQMGWEQRSAAIEAELQQAADQELEAILEMVGQQSLPEEDRYLDGLTVASLRAARRPTPKPPSLKEQALLQLDTLNADLAMHGRGCDLSQIRNALEQLND